MSSASELRRALRQTLRFGAVGVANTLGGLAVIYAAKLLGAGDAAANLVGYAAGLTLGFLLNRQWTFDHRGAVLPALARYLLAFLAAYLVNLAVVLTLIERFGVNGFLAQALGIPPYAAVFFLLCRTVVFRGAPRPV